MITFEFHLISFAFRYGTLLDLHIPMTLHGAIGICGQCTNHHARRSPCHRTNAGTRASTIGTGAIEVDSIGKLEGLSSAGG